MSTHVHIERLVLEGLPIERHHAAHVQAAVESELATLLARDGTRDALTSGGATPSLSAAAIPIGRTAAPAQLGRQIARAVHGGFGK